MNLSFYTAAVGAREQQQHLDVVANNIANVNTAGFKAKKVSFSSLLYQNLNGIDNAQLPRGSGSRIASAATDFSSGRLMAGGGTQDYAIDGAGFFALLDTTSGEVSFTRDGSFNLASILENTGGLDAEGQPIKELHYYLSDGEGRFVLSTTGQMIRAEDAAADYPVGVFDFLNTDGMQNLGGNRFLPVAKNGQVRVGSGTARHNVLESSNVDLANEITKVIESQRSFSYALKMVETSDEIETTINGLRN